ncbi:GreA/GreB family transcription elongation factor [Idiomarina abyssalis]|nr:GreA/GreB family transcription elongation factor [Idiomarina abyssalis]|tara:strand:+ start:626 stop:1057 length:432 start_codon:yes stop_codon:yes gene_type:complete
MFSSVGDKAVLKRAFRFCKTSVCPSNPIFQEAGQQMLIDPVELSILLNRLEFSESKEALIEKRIRVGASVVLRNVKTMEQVRVRLVPPELADTDNYLVSFISPLGSTLLGLRVGDIATVIVKGISIKWEVLTVNQNRLASVDA